MNHLAILQREFQRHVLHDEGKIFQHISNTGRADPVGQLAVYANAYRMRLIEVLRTDFPALSYLIGDDEFDILAQRYIDTYPSHNFSLRPYGQHMTVFLQSDPRYRETTLLAEMSLFEWTLNQAFDTEDKQAITQQEISRLPPEKWPDMVFGFHTSVRSIRLHWNVPALWSAYKNNHTLPDATIYDSSTTWVVWRNDLKTWFRSLDTREALAFELAWQGEEFSEICEQLAEWMEAQTVPQFAASMLKTWVNDGMICRTHP